MKKQLVVSLTFLLILTVSTAVAKVDILTLSLFRFYAPIGDSATKEDETADSTFRPDRFIVMFRGSVNDNIKGVANLYIHPWVPVSVAHLYFESCYAEYSCEMGGLKHKLLVGNGRNINFGITPSYGNRKTTEYSIVSDMFTHDRIIGLQYKGTAEMFNFGVSVHNGYKLAARATGGPKSKKVPFLADRGLDLKNFYSDNNQGKEISGRLGLMPIKGLDVGASGSFALGGLYDDGKDWKEDDPVVDDLDFLKANLGIDSESTDKIRFGGDLTYKPSIEAPITPSVLQGQFYYGMTGDLNHMGWQGLLGLKAKEFNTDMYIVFNQIMLDLEDKQRSANPYTWNISQGIFSVVYNITKTMHVECSYVMNLEDTPEDVDSVNNDYLFAELFTVLR